MALVKTKVIRSEEELKNFRNISSKIYRSKGNDIDTILDLINEDMVNKSDPDDGLKLIHNIILAPNLDEFQKIKLCLKCGEKGENFVDNTNSSNWINLAISFKLFGLIYEIAKNYKIDFPMDYLDYMEEFSERMEEILEK